MSFKKREAYATVRDITVFKIGIGIINNPCLINLSTESAGNVEESHATPDSMRNAIRVLMACRGSTNLFIHLKAIMHRAGFGIDIMELDATNKDTPLLVNVKPYGTNPVGAEFHNAGGVSVLMKELEKSSIWTV